MGTSARIAIRRADGTVRSIYCHYDGYLSGVGKTLKDMYDNEKSINQLLDLGDISALGNNPVSKPELWDLTAESLLAMKSGEYTRAYKDRGEDCPAKVYKSISHWMDHDNEVNYNYIFVDGEWLLADDEGLEHF